jgi:hypothetical protein
VSGCLPESVLYSGHVIDRRKNNYGVPVDRRSVNRRAFPRWPAQFEVCFGAGFEMTMASAIEIGEGGLSFHSENAIALESEINVEYRLEADDWVKVRAVVRHVKDGKIGVEFLNLRRDDRLKILDFISAAK